MRVSLRFLMTLLAVSFLNASVGCAWLYAGETAGDAASLSVPPSAASSPAAASTSISTLETDYFKARMALAEGRPEVAGTIIERCLLDENCPPLVYALGAEIRQKAGDAKGALELIDRGIVRHPEAPDLYITRAVMMAQAGKTGESITALNNALAIQPHRQDVLELLSNLHLQRLRAVRSEADLKTEIEALTGVYEKMLETRRGVERLAPLLVLNSLYLRTNQPARALAMAEEAVDINPHEVRGYLALGAAQEAAKQPVEARKTYRRALLAEPGNKEVLSRIEALFADSANSPERIAFYRELAQEYHTDKNLQQLFAQVLLEAHLWKEADEVVKKNLAAWPDDLESQLANVRVLVELDQLEELLALAGKLDPTDENHTPLLVLSVAQALVVKDRRPDALALLDKHQASFADNENMVLATASLLIDERQYDRAVGMLERYRVANSEAYLPALLLAEIYVEEDRFDDAHALLDGLPEALKTKNEEDLLRMRAQIYHRQKEYTRALELYQELSKRFPKNALYYLEAAMVHQELGQTTEAETNYRRALELDPEDPEANNALGYFYAETNQKLDEALTLVQKALTLNPKAGHIIDSLGWVLYRMGRFNDAVASLEEAVEIMKDTPDAVIFEHLGDAHEKAGNTAKARDAWRKALDLDKESTALKEKVNRYK